MTTACARVVAWGLVMLSVVLLLAAYAVYVVADAFELTLTDAFTVVITVAFGAIGAVIATRQATNAIGWIFLGVAVFIALGELAHGYAAFSLGDGSPAGSLGGAAATYAEVSWVPFVLVPASFLILLFPDGNLPSRRWRPVAWAAALGIVGTFVTSALHPGRLRDFPALLNPYGVDGALLEPLTGLSYLALLAGVTGSAVSIFVRFRRGTLEQRQQIKWLAVAGAASAPATLVSISLYDILGDDVANALLGLPVLGLAVAAGIAILQYRLYDIDVVINRALVYGALTATLAATYLGLVLLLGLTAGKSDVAIAASTLAVAGLFRPARGRIQAAVDRRFYRQRYDAAQTLAGFSARLRDELDIKTLGDDLRGVVRETVHPAHVSLWLREPP